MKSLDHRYYYLSNWKVELDQVYYSLPHILILEPLLNHHFTSPHLRRPEESAAPSSPFEARYMYMYHLSLYIYII